ncbi:MAG: hypothetical protein IEMM0002_1196 [bacterium]|nr:MAG: hypothetical protein IEMM0002_1196 [bacterium]
MKPDLETSIVHDGGKWIAQNEKLKACGQTLPELDDDMARAIRECGEFKGKSNVTVFMGFDYTTIPVWLRQYATHYFNRRVTIDLQP